MILESEEILQKIESFGRYDYSPRQIAIMLELSPEMEHDLEQKMRDPDSLVRRAYDRGHLLARQETIEHLRKNVEKGEEGAGDAARAINYLNRKNKEDEIRKDLFGV
jgi:hypothetical protein